MARKKLSRTVLMSVAAVAVGGALALAFWPRAIMVDMARAVRGQLQMTIAEEGHTRVEEAYVVSTPIAGRLSRVELHPGDIVTQATTKIATMRPANPAALDVRTREQALANMHAAEAALRVAEADAQAAKADWDLAKTDLERTQSLFDRGTVSQAALERAQSAARAARARSLTADAAIAQARAQLQASQAQLIGFEDKGLMAALEQQVGDAMPIYAPISGVVLQVFHQDETTLAAGSQIMELGDVESGLEVVAKLISSDAVQVSPGDPVNIVEWGGEGVLSGTVKRIEPFGQTKVSALGVEEQRVIIVIGLDTPFAQRNGLGHGYRVAVEIIIWQEDDVTKVPSAALFRQGDSWAVFVVSSGRAVLTQVDIGKDNGTEAQVLDGLSDGDRVILYPSATIDDGSRVRQRQVE